MWLAVSVVGLGVVALAFTYYALQLEIEQPESWSYQPAPDARALRTAEFKFTALPVESQIDQQIHIKISRLQPGEEVWLRASTSDADEVRFDSWAKFIADGAGHVDLAKQAPTSGSYQSIDPMGLFWSMEEPGRKRFRHSEQWVLRQYQLSAETPNGIVSVNLARRYPAMDLELSEFKTGPIHAELWINPIVEKPPVVIRLPGSDGRYDRLKSSLIASHGFAVLDLRYHRGNARGLPPSNQIPLERVTASIDWLEAIQEEYGFDADQIGVFGSSKGAELGLIAGTLDRRIDALFLWAPASMAFEGGTFSDPKGGSSWTWQGRSIPFAAFRYPYLDGAIAATRLSFGKPFSFLPIYQEAIEDADEAALISVDNIPGTVMLAAGEDDRMWPSMEMGRNISKRVRARARSICLVEKYYENVGHRMNYELWPRGGTPDLFIMGGARDASYLAGADIWRRMIDFFSKTLIKQESFCI